MAYLIEPIAGSQKALVFGAVWASTIGANPEKQARQRARKTKAQFYTRARTRSTVVGMLTLARAQGKPDKTLELYSAAAAFAHAYARGAVAVHLPLRDGGFWVSAAIDGMVQIGTDVVHENAESAQQHLEQLRLQHPSLQVFGNDAGETRLREGVFLDNLTEAVKLKRTATTIADIPRIVWLVLAALAALLAWNIVQHHDSAQQQALRDTQSDASPVDPVAAWKDALHAWSQTQTMHGMSALEAMMASIARLPVTPGRWELDTVDCQPTGCQALYRRTRLADNPSLQSALPAAWPIRWIDMDNASVSVPTHWIGKQHGDIAAMPDEAGYVQHVLTRWQRLQPAMEDIRIGAKTLAHVPAPLAPNADGNPAPLAFPEHAGLIHPSLREITIHAPLRTLAALALPTQSQTLLLQVRRNHASTVDLNHSVFQAMFKGVLYVQ